MQAKVADMYVMLQSARSYVYNVAKACDAGQTTRFDAAGCILLASENAVKVAGEAIQALGGAGYTKDWPGELQARIERGAGAAVVGQRRRIGRLEVGAHLRAGLRVRHPDRQSVVDGKGGAGRVVLCGRRII